MALSEPTDNHLVGRSEQLKAIRFATLTAQTQFCSMLIEGPAGIGKSALIDAAIGMPEVRGCWIAIGRATRATRDQPFAPLLEALSPTTGSVHGLTAPHGTPTVELPAAIRELLRSPTERTNPGLLSFVADLRLRALDSLCDHLEALAAVHPVVLVVEDLHEADEATIIVLVELHRRLRGLPALVLATARTTELGPHEVLGKLRAEATNLVSVPRLTPDDGERLTRPILGASPGPILSKVLADAGGNPLLLLTIANSLLRSGAVVAANGMVELAGPVPSTALSSTVRHRIHELSESDRHLVRAAAVLGTEFSMIDLGEMTGAGLASMVGTLRNAAASGLLQIDARSPRFLHDLVRDAVVEDTDPDKLRDLHLAAADVAMRAGAPPSRVLAHLDGSGAASPDLVQEWVLRTADEANRREPLAAHRLYGRAAKSIAFGTTDWVDVQFRRLESAASAGLLEDAEGISRELLSATSLDVDQEFEAAWWVGSVLFLRNRVHQSIAVLEDAAARTALPSLRARLLAMAALGHLAGSTDHTDAATARALEAAEASQDAVATTIALSARSRHLQTTWDFGMSLQFALRAVEVADREPTRVAHRFQPGFFLGLSYLDLCDLTAARAAALRAHQVAIDIGTSWAESLYCLLSALTDLTEGKVDDATAQADAGQRAAAAAGADFSQLWLKGVDAVLRVRRGELDAAAESIRVARALVGNGQYSGLDVVVVGEAFMMRSKGELSSALAHLHDAWDFFDAVGATWAGVTLLLPYVALAVEDSRDDLLFRASVFANRWRVAASRPGLLFVDNIRRGLELQDIAQVLDAIELLRVDNRTLETADIERAVANRLRLWGALDVADRVLDDARALYEEAGAPGDADSCFPMRAAQRNRGGRPRRQVSTGWESLTLTERTVAYAIADGLANKAIAARLGVSIRTIESHVSRILTKLSATSRVQVALDAERHREHL